MCLPPPPAAPAAASVSGGQTDTPTKQPTAKVGTGPHRAGQASGAGADWRETKRGEKLQGHCGCNVRCLGNRVFLGLRGKERLTLIFTAFQLNDQAIRLCAILTKSKYIVDKKKGRQWIQK